MDKISTTRSLENLNFFYFWGIFRQVWIFVIAAMILAGGITWLITKFFVKPSYTSSVTLFAYDGEKKQNSDNVNSEANNSQMQYVNIMFGEKLVNDYRELLKSYTLSEEVEAELDREFPNLKEMKYSYETKIERNTRFIYLSVTAKDKRKAMRAAQITAEKFRDKVTKFMNVNFVQIIDSARLPQFPSAPRKFKIAAIASILGGLLVYMFFFLIDFLNYTVRDPEEVKTELGQALLGTLPVVGTDESSSSGPRKLILAGYDKSKYSFIPAYEDFKLIRTNLQYSMPNTGKARVILVSSAQPGDGKSFVAANLADTIAETGKKVLIINTDLRKPTMHSFFDLNRQPGLVDILLKEHTLEEVIHRNVGDKSLDVITGGPIPPDPTSIIDLFSDSGIIEKARQEYDYIIIDSPPCLNMADALLSGRIADGVILVTRFCSTSIVLAKHSLENLSNAKLKILGVILNGYAPEQNHYGYKYGYKYGYGGKKGYGGYGYGGYGYGGYGYGGYGYGGYGEDANSSDRADDSSDKSENNAENNGNNK